MESKIFFVIRSTKELILSFSFLIFFARSLVIFNNLLIFRLKWRCPETKWFKELFYRVDSICPSCQTNTQQFERAIKWKWKFEQLKDFSLKSLWVFCQNVWFSFSQRLYRGYTGFCYTLFTLILCLMPEITLLNNSATVSLVFIENDKNMHTIYPLQKL